MVYIKIEKVYILSSFKKIIKTKRMAVYFNLGNIKARIFIEYNEHFKCTIISNVKNNEVIHFSELRAYIHMDEHICLCTAHDITIEYPFNTAVVLTSTQVRKVYSWTSGSWLKQI